MSLIGDVKIRSRGLAAVTDVERGRASLYVWTGSRWRLAGPRELKRAQLMAMRYPAGLTKYGAA